jgi:hypothetical protein
MSLSALDTWAFWLTVAAIALPVLGGAAAFFALYFSSQADTLREAADARFKVESTTKIAEANARAAEANEKAALANENAARLSELAAKAELELAALKEKTAPRTLDPGSRATIIDSLAGSGETIRMWSHNSPEPIDFKKQLREALEAAGWTISQSTAGVQFGNVTVGLRVWFRQQEPPPAALALHNALNAAGLSAPLERSGNARTDEVVLAVGFKP